MTDPCAIIQKSVDDLEAQLANQLEALGSGEIPVPRTPANVARVEAGMRELRSEIAIANRELQSCRHAHAAP